MKNYPSSVSLKTDEPVRRAKVDAIHLRAGYEIYLRIEQKTRQLLTEALHKELGIHNDHLIEHKL